MQMDPDLKPYGCTQRNKKISNNVAQVWKITIFDRQTVRQTPLFNGASMEAITYGFSEVP